MTNEDNRDSITTTNAEPNNAPTPLRCFVGAIVAAGISYLAWNLTQSIALAFAAKQITSDNMIVIRISIAVRTLVVGLSTFGAGIFGFAALGLAGLGIKLLIAPDKPSENS